MAVAFTMDCAGGTAGDYDAVVEKMQLGGRLSQRGLQRARRAGDGARSPTDLRLCLPRQMPVRTSRSTTR
jgi:hypothetical protein